MSRLFAAGLLSALAPPPSPRAADVELLPDVSVHLEAARYQPTEADLHWTGWIGAGAGLARVDAFTGYFTADVEIILGWERRPFEATQANYHLELGVRRPVGSAHRRRLLPPRVPSRRGPRQAGGGGLERPRRSPARPGDPTVRLRASAGHTTQASLVGYRLELTAGLDVGWGRPSTPPRDVRFVTVEPDPLFPVGTSPTCGPSWAARWPREKGRAGPVRGVRAPQRRAPPRAGGAEPAAPRVPDRLRGGR